MSRFDSVHTRVPRRTLIYLAILALLVIVFILQETGEPARHTITVPELPEKIDAIRFSKGEKTVELRSGENGEGWRVGEQSYPADNDLVADIIEAVRNTEEADVISERENYDDYGLGGDAEKMLEFSEGGETVLLLHLGDPSSTGDAIYGRIGENSEVALLPSEFGSNFSVEVSYYRSKEMADIPEKEIEKIEIRSPDFETVIIERAKELGHVAEEGVDDRSEKSAPSSESGTEFESQKQEQEWRIGSGNIEDEEIDIDRFDQLFRNLSPLRAEGFPEEAPSGDAFASLRVYHGGTQTLISFWPPDEEGNYPARVSSSKYSFTLPKWRVKQLLLGLECYTAPFEKKK